MNELIQRITSITRIEIPKSQHDRNRVVSAFGSIVGETENVYLVPCCHELSTPADEDQIENAELQLSFAIPEQYKKFLRISNGAKLFVVPRNRPQGGHPHVRYQLFSCEELVKIHQFCLRTFIGAYADDPEYKNVKTLNYMAFCDATNDNYQAFVLDGPHTSEVFLLFYEFQCRPYSELDADFYYTISDSLETWFDLIVQTGGWGGRGIQSGSL